LFVDRMKDLLFLNGSCKELFKEKFRLETTQELLVFSSQPLEAIN